MRSTRWLVSLVWLVALLHLPSAFAMQRPDHFPKPGDYSVRMPGHDGRASYHEAPASKCENSVLYLGFRRIEGWQRPPDQKAELSSLLFQFRRVDDAIEVRLSVVYPVGRIQVLPTSGGPVAAINSFSLRLGESAHLQELASYGIEPFEIKVVSSNSRTINPSLVNNLTKALEVVRIDKARSHYRITYKNISKKNILAMRAFYSAHEYFHGGFPVFHMKPLMTPGEIFQAELDNDPERMKKTGFSDYGYSSDEREPLEVTLLGVVFDDFTYEGDKEDAMRVAARVRAQQIQFPPILSMWKEAEAAYRYDKQSAINKLKKRAAAIKTEPESNVIADLAKRFSPLTEKEASSLVYHLRNQMAAGKKDLFEFISVGECLERTNGGFVPGGQNWVTSQRDGYESYLRALLSMDLLR